VWKEWRERIRTGEREGRKKQGVKKERKEGDPFLICPPFHSPWTTPPNKKKDMWLTVLNADELLS